MRIACLAVLFAACASHPAPAAAPLAPLPVSSSGIARTQFAAALDHLENDVDAYCACADDACRSRSATAYTDESIAQLRAHLDDWPSDLDEIDGALVGHFYACADEHGGKPKELGRVLQAAADEIRDDACACTDATCAAKEKDRFFSLGAGTVDFKLDQATLDGIKASAKAAKACITPLIVQQATLDLKAIRRDACACHDQACATDANQRFGAWAKANQDVTGSKSDADAVKEIVDDLSRCLNAVPK